MTALGAATVFLTREVSHKLLDTMLGFAAGVMIAASYWSLLAPSVALSRDLGVLPWLPPTVGFALGGLFLWYADRVVPHLHPELAGQADGDAQRAWKRAILLVLAITLHNIPEGMAVGVAFGGAAAGLPASSLGIAVALAIGIGLQNFPEGVIISMPLRQQGVSKARSFFYGQLSAAVEPVAGVIGAAAVIAIRPLLPYALAFAAGAMIYVVVRELVPESQKAEHAHISVFGTMLGFIVMMILDVALS